MSRPESLPLSAAFVAVFRVVIDSGYSSLTDGFAGYGKGQEEIFDADVSNAICEAYSWLGIEATPEDEGTAHDWLEAALPAFYGDRFTD